MGVGSWNCENDVFVCDVWGRFGGILKRMCFFMCGGALVEL